MIVSYGDLVIVVDDNMTVYHNNRLISTIDGLELYKLNFSFEEMHLLYCVHNAITANSDIITEINNLIFPFPDEVKISIDN